MLQTAFRPSCMNQSSVFEWHKRFKEGRESLRDNERCGRSKEVNTPEFIGQRVRMRVRVTMLRFKWVQEEISSEEVSTLLIRSVAFPAGQCASAQLHPCHRLFDQDGHQDSSSASLWSRPCSLWFWLFPNLKGCRYETIEVMKEAVTKVIDALTQEDFDGAFQKLLERYNKFIAAGGDFFEGYYCFMCVLSIKVLFTNPSARAGYDTRSIFKRTLTCLNSEFSFS